MSTETTTEQHYTLGIAGHIDHGKTTLTKALTGKETDRLKEEQLRKISIELGFASFSLPNGKNVGVIDVPGHERFIRQMVAGVAGIDIVLLVVAADEGVMPQTKEHLDILNILGVDRGIIVLTKVDTVDEEFLELVKESVREETDNTFLAKSPMLEVDSLSGKGIEPLKKEIENLTSSVIARPIQGIARLPIDRAFSKKGFGTVVTGTMVQGKISVGEELEVLPLGQKVKVRNIQVHDQSKETAYAGQRVAVNISDVGIDQLKRGDSLVTRSALEKTSRVDIEFTMLPDIDFELKQRSDIRLHIGTSEVLGRIIFFDRNESKAGETCFAQLELLEPITTLFQERFVIRRPTPMTTIGGGMVIDPYARKHRFGPQTVESISAKKEGDLATRATHILKKDGIQTLQELTHQLGVSIADWYKEMGSLEETEKDLKLIKGETDQLTLITTQSSWNHTWEAIDEELETYHKRYPLRDGIDRLQIQKKYFAPLTAAQWNVVLKHAFNEERIQVKKEVISQFHFSSVLREKDEQIWQKIENNMRNTLVEVPEWSELVPTQMPADVSVDLQRWLLRQGKLIQLEENRYLSKDLFVQLVEQLKEKTPGSFSIQEVRQVFDTSRKYLIPFLELLDRQGYTTRQDNERTWK
jgi:selenocysteine-specific elongation factor